MRIKFALISALVLVVSAGTLGCETVKKARDINRDVGHGKNILEQCADLIDDLKDHTNQFQQNLLAGRDLSHDGNRPGSRSSNGKGGLGSGFSGSDAGVVDAIFSDRGAGDICEALVHCEDAGADTRGLAPYYPDACPM